MDVSAEGEVSICKDLWYPDGTVVLQAESTVYRVYSGMLSQYSPVFRGLFDIPQPHVQEVYDGTPLVKLSDTARDIYNFLKTIHDIR